MNGFRPRKKIAQLKTELDRACVAATSATKNLAMNRLAGAAHAYRLTSSAYKSLEEITYSYVKRIQETARIFGGHIESGPLASHVINGYASVHEHMALVLTRFGKSAAASSFAYENLRDEFKIAKETLGKESANKILKSEWDDSLPPEIMSMVSS
jgi:hypothetical protein